LQFFWWGRDGSLVSVFSVHSARIDFIAAVPKEASGKIKMPIIAVCKNMFVSLIDLNELVWYVNFFLEERLWNDFFG
jgi:hypothetical protein